MAIEHHTADGPGRPKSTDARKAAPETSATLHGAIHARKGPARFSRRLRWQVPSFFVFAAAGWLAVRYFAGSPAQAAAQVGVAAHTDLAVTVSERGELESSNTIEVRCEVEGYQNKLISIVPEGSRVTRGQVVATFDSDQLSRQVLEQDVRFKTAQGRADIAVASLEIEKQTAASNIARAELAKITAQLDREEYIPTDKNMEGDYQVDIDEKKGEIELARRNLEDAQDRLEKYRRFVRKGFGTPEQLRVKELEVAQLQYAQSSKKAKLIVTQTVQHKKKEAELVFKAQDSERDLIRTKRSSEASIKRAEAEKIASEDALRSEKQSLERLRQQIERCVVRSPAAGIMVYSKEYAWDPASRVQAGAMIHFQQPLFSLPDLARMQVKVKIHESVIKKILLKQKAEIQVDAFPNQILHGTVEKVATLPDSRGPWDERGVKEYPVVVRIDDLPAEAALKPGMSALVKISVSRLKKALVVPLQAVSERQGVHYAYKVGSDGVVTRHEVEVGESNETHVAIKEGLAAGDTVALDARTRVAVETAP